MRYLMKFSYDGSGFNGYQKQNNLRTVQGLIEEALFSLIGKEINIQASGRTDKGVHALEQYAHFDIDKEYKLYNLKKYLNNYFEGEIYVQDIKIVDDNFHARYNVKEKKYCYYINMGEYNPILRNCVYQYGKKLDVDLMKEAIKCLIGEHDFRAFVTGEKEKDNCVRIIYNIEFEVVNDILKITFVGNGFLRKMIRNIVGALILIGNGDKSVNYIKEILLAKERVGNLKCAFAGGLYLEEVNYDD